MSYCEQSPTLGMMVNGNYVILGGTYPKTESECTLSDILEEKVDQKYFLSQKALVRLTNNEEGFRSRLVKPYLQDNTKSVEE